MLPQDIERINKLARKIGKTVVVIDNTAGSNVVILGLDEFERIIELDGASSRVNRTYPEGNKKSEPYEAKSLTGMKISDSINRSKTDIERAPQGVRAPSSESEASTRNPFTFPQDTYEDIDSLGSVEEDMEDPDEPSDLYYLEPTEEV